MKMYSITLERKNEDDKDTIHYETVYVKAHNFREAEKKTKLYKKKGQKITSVTREAKYIG